MLDKSKLGARYVCFQCGTKFYDLNRPVPSCPECQADQGDAPVQDIRRLLTGRGKRRAEKEAPAPAPAAPKEPAADEDDDLGTAVEGEEEAEEAEGEAEGGDFLPTA